LDVTDTDNVQALASQLASDGKSPTVLVNNAGITKDTLMLRMKPEDWQAVIDTNLTSIYTVVSAFIKPMTKARTGRIINISSVVGSMGNAGQVNYAAAKAGLEGMTRAMAREFGSRAITVNAIAPGFIETDMTHALPEEQKATLLSQVPLGRLGSADEVAGCVAFLASEEASYVTGTTLHVNGGMYMA
jgi:Dehydrogenases with different specificities (related to short-chain alcohol dehydrogenases)